MVLSRKTASSRQSRTAVCETAVLIADAAHPIPCLASIRPFLFSTTGPSSTSAALSLCKSDGTLRTDCRNSSRRAREPVSHAGCLVRQIPLTTVFQELLCNQPGILAQCLLHLAGEFGVVAEE